ncbi:MAG: hypothetical protein LQ337_008428 [Flavoplaca oasis]|nr:MAG: hypothetical protein LQ337_008428 [Flavoplaca oasis]
MPDVTEASDGYVPPPRTGPNPFQVVDPNVITEDGGLISFFLKVALDEQGRRMMHGEFESMMALYKVVPDFVPKPHAWGSYKDIEGVHFFLCSFHDMTEEMPEVESFCESVARLHLNSVSPNNMYGFPLTTYMGPLPQDNTWCSTWEEYFKQGMVRMLDLERNVQGPSEKLERLTAQLFERVIPRLLRPLTVLKSMKPVLIHGDLWYGNCCTDNDTGRPIVFDACVQWAHNEYEIGTWRAVRYRFGKTYIKAYHKYYPISAPEEDHDDRNALYSIRYDLHSSSAYSSSPKFRRDVMATMETLIAKFPDGYEGWERDHEDLIREHNIKTSPPQSLGVQAIQG